MPVLNASTNPETAVELTDSDYPPVYGDNPKASPKSERPSVAIVDHRHVCDILNREGYEIEVKQVRSLNFFPSPMDAFQYALYSFGMTDVYIVLMINKRQNSIYGYHVLDLTQEYSLVDDLITQLKAKNFVSY